MSSSETKLARAYKDPHVKAVEVTSAAYAQATTYRRTSVLIDHGQGRSYVVDFFRVEGGATQDFVFHASAPTVDLPDTPAQPSTTRLYDLANIRDLQTTDTPWRLTWPAGPHLTAVAWSLPQPGEVSYLADGWGQRDWRNTDLGATLPYLLRRTTGEGLKTFASVFEAHPGSTPFIRKVTRRSPDVIEIETTLSTDTVTSRLAVGPASTLTVVSMQNGQTVWEFSAP